MFEKPVKAAKPTVHTNPSTKLPLELGPELDDWDTRRTEEMMRRITELIIKGVNF